jgi:hypothetical protein
MIAEIREKSDALNFLQTLHANLEQTLPAGPATENKVAELLELGATDASYRHLCSPEHAFTRGIALPRVHDELTGTLGLSAENAREALLAEGWTNLGSISSDTPARTVRHPFDKAMVSDAWSVYQKWMGNTSRVPLTQSCPDFALRPPAPHKIVFEAKYFSGGSSKQAAKELVADVYQAFFYRALPPTDSQRARSWDYDYACLFAFDASPDRAFLNAWEALHEDVQAGFWDGANVYVMVLTGS